MKIVCVGAGLVYGSLGMSHHATEDCAVLRALPDVVIMAPATKRKRRRQSGNRAYPGTCYLRLGRGGERQIHTLDRVFTG